MPNKSKQERTKRCDRESPSIHITSAWADAKPVKFITATGNEIHHREPEGSVLGGSAPTASRSEHERRHKTSSSHRGKSSLITPGLRAKRFGGNVSDDLGGKRNRRRAPILEDRGRPRRVREKREQGQRHSQPEEDGSKHSHIGQTRAKPYPGFAIRTSRWKIISAGLKEIRMDPTIKRRGKDIMTNQETLRIAGTKTKREKKAAERAAVAARSSSDAASKFVAEGS